MCIARQTTLKKPKKINIVLQTLNVSPLVEKMEDMFGPNTKPYDIGTYIAYGKDYPNSFRAWSFGLRYFAPW